MENPDPSKAVAPGSPSSSSEEDSDAETAALEARVAELESQASAASSYDLLLELLKGYRVLGELQKLRDIRKQFHASFPLSHDLWMEWIDDEKQLAQTEEDKSKVVDLYHRAAKDYFSVDIYVKLVQYMQEIGHAELENGMEQALGKPRWSDFIDFGR